MFFSKLLSNLKVRLILYCMAILCIVIFTVCKNIIAISILYSIIILLFKFYINKCIKKYLDTSSDIKIKVRDIDINKLPSIIDEINSICKLHYKNWIINLKDLGFVIISSIIISLLYGIIPLNLAYYSDLTIFNGIACSLLASVGMSLIIHNLILFDIAKNKLTIVLKESKEILNRLDPNEIKEMTNQVLLHTIMDTTDRDEMDMIWEEYKKKHKYLTEDEVKRIIKRKSKNTHKL